MCRTWPKPQYLAIIFYGFRNIYVFMSNDASHPPSPFGISNFFSPRLAGKQRYRTQRDLLLVLLLCKDC